MCDGLEIPFFHRVLAQQDLSDPLEDTFSARLLGVKLRWQPASTVQQTLGDDEIAQQSIL